MPGLLADLAAPLERWGYLAVGFLVFVECFGVPVPGETVMIAAAVYAGAGRLDIAVVVTIAVISAVLGDNVGYCIGRYGGHRLVGRYGRWMLLTPARLASAEGFFTRHGGKVVTIARFIDGLRQVNGIIAGLTGMRWRRFLAYNSLGAALWVGMWAFIGTFAGEHINTIYPVVQHAELYVLGGVVLLVARLVVRRRRRRTVPPHPVADAATTSA